MDFRARRALRPAAVAGKHAAMEPGEYARMDAVEAEMWWYRALHARLFDALAPVRGRVLDAGCGTGGFLALARLRRPDLALVGLEWDHWAARRAAAKSASPVARGSVAEMPFADASFDAVISTDVLCHEAVDPGPALAEMRRVLRPGGSLVLNMPAFMWLHSAHDVRVRNARRVSAPQLRAWLDDAGFLPRRVAYWNGLLLPLMLAQRKILARGHDSASDVAAFPPWLDASLHGVTALERALRLRLPAGGSVMALAIRQQ